MEFGLSASGIYVLMGKQAAKKMQRREEGLTHFN